MPLKSFNEVVLLYALRERPDFADTCRRFLEECANRDAAEIGLARELDKGLEVIFRDPCALMRSPTINGRGCCSSATAVIAEATDWLVSGCACRSAGVVLASASRSAVMCAGVEPQQPPTTLTPKSRTNAASSLASSSGVSG